MFLLQAISIIFGLFMIYVVRIHRRKGHLDPFEYGIWLALWCGFIFLTVFPQLIAGISQTLHIARVFDLLVIVSMMVLVTLSFLNRVETKKIEKKLEELIRKRAVNEKR